MAFRHLFAIRSSATKPAKRTIPAHAAAFSIRSSLSFRLNILQRSRYENTPIAVPTVFMIRSVTSEAPIERTYYSASKARLSADPRRIAFHARMPSIPRSSPNGMNTSTFRKTSPKCVPVSTS